MSELGYAKRDDVTNEIAAVSTLLELIAGKLIASHPERDRLVVELRDLRRQTTASRDPSTFLLDRALQRLEARVTVETRSDQPDMR